MGHPNVEVLLVSKILAGPKTVRETSKVSSFDPFLIIDKSDNMKSPGTEVAESSHMMRFGRSISAILVLSNHLQQSELKLEDIFKNESGGKGNNELLC